jgi:hypothetical protein
MDIEKLLNGFQERVIIGQTNLYVDRKNKRVIINHAGNDNDNEDTLKKRVDKVFGEGTWVQLHASAKSVKTEGYIPRLYTETLQF